MTDRTLKPHAPARFRCLSRVRFVDTDASGRIHFTALFRHAEVAELEFLRSGGLAYSTEGRYGMPRVHVEADYQGAIRFDDLLDIGVQPGRVGRASFEFLFDFQIGDRRVATARIVIACMDRTTQSACELPEDFRSFLLRGAGTGH